LPAALDDPDQEPIEIAVAVEDNALIGAIVFGPEGSTAVTVFAIGVIRPRQREGIGTMLKVAAVAEVAFNPDWPARIQSVVHRENTAMLRVNEKLGATIAVDPLDPRYVLTAIVPRKSG